ncbi:MAG: beta-eliminating lyase-related protein [Gammaproteobacteria bacterium]|nr:beta-eliminating lyase-related protein [Gammaproteobacteria bacterium]
MVGDGLGLTPRQTAAVLEGLAAGQAITPDWYSVGGAVDHLERQFARELGKDRAIFMPTGTLANHLAVRALAAGHGRAIVQAESHLYNDAGDCVQRLSGIPLVPLGAGRRDFTLAQVQRVMDRTTTRRVAAPVSVISIETPVRRRYGETFDAGELENVTAYARDRGIGLHLDGARLHIQAAYEDRPVADYAALFDTVYISLYKSFNTPSGAILAGPKSLLDGMVDTRRMFGSGLPAAWPFAVASHYARGFISRFGQAVAVSEAFFAELSTRGAFAVERIPYGTNIARLQVKADDLPAFRRRLMAEGIVLSPPRRTGFWVTVNETWSRRSAGDLVDSFEAAVAA